MVTGLEGLALAMKAVGLKNKAAALLKEQKELENKPMCELTLGEAKRGMERIKKIDEELIKIYIELNFIMILL